MLYYTYPSTKDVLINPANPLDTRKDGTEILELKAGVSGEILPKLTATATYYYSPDYHSYNYGVFEGNLAYALPKTWVFDPVVSGTIGYQNTYGDHVSNYAYWNAGIALTVDKLTFDFRYWGTDLSNSEETTFYFANPTVADDRFVFSTTLALP